MNGKMQKRTLAVCLAACLAAGLFGGCRQVKYAKTDTTSVPADSNSSSEPAYTVPADLDTTAWELMLFNRNYPGPEDYAPELVDITEDFQVDARIKDALQAMMDAAKEAGVPLYVNQAYRSYARQKSLFDNEVERKQTEEGLSEEDAVTETSKSIAVPGSSDHQTGLGVDLISDDWFFVHGQELDESFDQTPTYAWLAEHAAEYGFIQRYPKGKESITMVEYEPWHFRYVGAEHAQQITSLGLTLEEYVGKAVASQETATSAQ